MDYSGICQTLKRARRLVRRSDRLLSPSVANGAGGPKHQARSFLSLRQGAYNTTGFTTGGQTTPASRVGCVCRPDLEIHYETTIPRKVSRQHRRLFRGGAVGELVFAETASIIPFQMARGGRRLIGRPVDFPRRQFLSSNTGRRGVWRQGGTRNCVGFRAPRRKVCRYWVMPA